MRVLFLTLANVYDLNDHDIYQDLMRCFASHGHEVYVVTGAERQKGLKTELYDSCGCKILRVQTGNQSDCSLVEKGISTLTLQKHYWNAIQTFLCDISLDLVLYATPPITLMGVIKKLKKKYACKTYLMLKDIFPQNAVDLGMMRKNGALHTYFRGQERALYAVSDHIGCMSEANIEYVLSHNAVEREKVELCPNALLPREQTTLSAVEQADVKAKYSIPQEKLVLLYGGNLGKPQGIDFLIECLIGTKTDEDIFTVVIGSGSEYKKLSRAMEENNITNALLLSRMPREDYFRLNGIADVGLVFLDYRFTIPNFPSRILSYMENGIPVACVTDRATDIGAIAQSAGFGWSCPSDDVAAYRNMLACIKKADLAQMGKASRAYLEQNYHTEICYTRISEKL